VFCICVEWPSRDLPWSRTSINILFLNLLKPVVYYPSFSPSCITPTPAICIISSLLLSVFFRAVCECGVSLSRRPTSEESIKRLCFFLLPTRYVNKVYFPFPQIVCVYVFYFVPCEDFHIYHISTTNMPPIPRGCLFVFAVSRWFHVFWTPKETSFKNNYLVCTGTHNRQKLLTMAVHLHVLWYLWWGAPCEVSFHKSPHTCAYFAPSSAALQTRNENFLLYLGSSVISYEVIYLNFLHFIIILGIRVSQSSYLSWYLFMHILKQPVGYALLLAHVNPFHKLWFIAKIR